MMKKALAILAAGVLLTGLLASCNTAVPENITFNEAKQNTITVTASQVVKTIPDMAVISYGIQTEAEDAKTCQANNTADVNKVVEALKGMGIDEKNIKTSNYNLRAKYDYNSDVEAIVGYIMSTTIEVTGVEIAQVGDIVTKSVDAGINTIDSIQYEASDYDERYAEALDLAVKAAKAKAETMAKADGCSIKGVAGMIENGQNTSARYESGYESMKLAMSDTAAGSMNAMPGEVEIEARIEVTYEIKE